MKKSASVLVVLYSALCCILPIVFIYYMFQYTDFPMSFIFGELVDMDILKLNCYLLGFISFSSGTLGIVCGVSIWKGKLWAVRIWLILIIWQFILSFIQIGPYGIGSPDPVSITIVGCVLSLSAFAFLRQDIKNMLVSSKRHLYEISLIVVIISQIVCVAVLNRYEDDSPADISENNIEDLVKDGMMKALRSEMFGEHYEKYFEFMDLYEDKDRDRLRQVGAFLIENGYKGDRLLLRKLAVESYSRGKYSEAINYLKSALKGSSRSQVSEPPVEWSYFEEADLHYMLFLILSEEGSTMLAETEYKLSMDLYNLFCGDKDCQKLIKIRVADTKNCLNYFRKKGVGD